MVLGSLGNGEFVWVAWAEEWCAWCAEERAERHCCYCYVRFVAGLVGEQPLLCVGWIRREVFSD